MFGTLRLPEVADSFRDDEAFAYWRVAGPNPLLIRRVDALPANFPLGEEQFRRVMGADDSLLEAAASRRLYLLDYAELGKLAPSGAVDKLLTGTGFAYAPIALFALGRGSGEAIAGGHPVRSGPRYPSDVRASRRVGE